MMKVEFNPSVSFRANDNNIQGKGKVELPDNKLSATNDSIDKLEIPAERLAQNAKPEKKGFIREGIAKFWKFFSVTDRMANAVLQGLLYGAAAGVVLAYELVKGKLDANQNTAVIDHKLHVGHRDV